MKKNKSSMFIYSMNDLKLWVLDHVSDQSSEEDVDKIVQAIYYDINRPNFSCNWLKYLSSLPENLKDKLC